MIPEAVERGYEIHDATLTQIEESSPFDAIVVGAGAAGGTAAMFLTEAGMRVLVLDAGERSGFLKAPFRTAISFMVPQLANPKWLDILPSTLINVGRRGLRLAGRMRQPVQSKCFAWLLAPDAFVDDRQCPYLTEAETQFYWFRSHQIGGRMIVPGHGRQYYRLSPGDYGPNERSGAAWPFQASELDPWYDLVEERLGLVGAYDGCPNLPDSQLRQVRKPDQAEQELMQSVHERWPSSHPVVGRSAPPLASIDKAASTGNLSCRRGAIVKNVTVDANGCVTGVSWVDRRSRRTQTAHAPVVFLCASSLETTRILMLSRSPKTEQHLGADSGVLGRYLMDHLCIGAEGIGPGLPDEPVSAEDGRCVFLPRFDLREGATSIETGKFGIQLYRWSTGRGSSYFNAVSFGEMLPHKQNRVVLSPSKTDAWGIPVLKISCRHGPGDMATAQQQTAALSDIADVLKIKLHRLDDELPPPGTAVHECGTARMGTAADNSVLDPDNQAWDAKGLYVTDGAAFPTQGAQNPTLTILALTARACAHAVRTRLG